MHLAAALLFLSLATYWPVEIECGRHQDGMEGCNNLRHVQVALCEHRLGTIASAAAAVPRTRLSTEAVAAAAESWASVDADGGAAAEAQLTRALAHWERWLGGDSALAAEARL